MPNPAWVGRLNSNVFFGAQHHDSLGSYRLRCKRTKRAPRKERCFISETPLCNKRGLIFPLRDITAKAPVSALLALRNRAYAVPGNLCQQLATVGQSSAAAPRQPVARPVMGRANHHRIETASGHRSKGTRHTKHTMLHPVPPAVNSLTISH